MVIDPSPPEILHEDAHIIVVVKPAGLPTANAARGQRSLFTLLAAARPRGDFLGVVSRLDAPVSGVVVLANTRLAAADLSRQFRERLVGKSYEAIVEGRFPGALSRWVDWHDRLTRQGDEHRSRVQLGRGHRGRGTSGRSAVGPGSASDTARAAPDSSGRCAGEDADAEGHDGDGHARHGADCHVRARVIRRLGEVSLVELVPSSGRRHQLRAQLAERRCPIVGDRTYGSRLPFPSGPGLGPAIALHARRLTFRHPHSGDRMEFVANRPAAWHASYPEFGHDGGEPPPQQVDRRVSG